jgi:hypothetical protein
MCVTHADAFALSALRRCVAALTIIVLRCEVLAVTEMRGAIVLVLVVIVGLAAVLFAPMQTYRHEESPDGEFVAVAKYSLFSSLMPVMPGQAGDKPGRVTIIRKDGWPCGSAAVEMVQMVGDVRWYLKEKPREASIVATARWNLDACSVEVYDR